MPSSQVFNKFKAGKLHSGDKKGPVVKNHAQAVAIYMSERENEAEHGGHYSEGARGRPAARGGRKRPSRRQS